MSRARFTAVPKPDFPRAFRTVRVSAGVPQEAFDVVSSRTYVSILERGVNAPTFAKIDSLVRVLGVHPLTVLALAYAKSPAPGDVDEVLERVRSDVKAMGVNEFLLKSLPRGPRAKETPPALPSDAARVD